MKKTVLFFVLFLVFQAFSQGKKAISSKVEYQIFNNTGLPNTLFSTLYIDTDATIYFEKYKTKIQKAPEDGTVILPPKFVFEPYTKFDHKKKEVFLFQTINARIFLVEDNYNNLNWTVTEESKDIAGYKCIKAITKFRGREWTAWFAPDVPLPYGPWKLHGLPGLIMEAYDADKIYVIQVVKIEFVRDDIFDKDFMTLYKVENTKPITYQKYLKDLEEYHENTRIQILEERKNVTHTFSNPSKMDKELEFEWDK